MKTMDHDGLRKALVEILADAIVQAKDRIWPDIELRLAQTKERKTTERMPIAVLPSESTHRSRFLDMKQAGEYMGMKAPAFRKMLERTPLPKGIVVRFGRKLRVDMNAFERWLVEQPTN